MSSLFGGQLSTNLQAPQLGAAPQINYTPAGYGTAGGSASFAGGQYQFTPSAAATSAIDGLQSTFQQQANAYGALANTVQPGFSQLRRAGLNQINTQQQATTSNLRDNLAQRRVLGSSFGNASISNSDAEFAQQKANFTAQSYLQEVSTSQQLIQQQYQAATQSYAAGINQMNFDTGIAAQLTSQASSAMANMAQAQASIDQKQALSQAQLQQQYDSMNNANSATNISNNNASIAGIGKLAGTAASIGLAPFTGGASLLALPAFTGGSGGGSGGSAYSAYQSSGGFFGGAQPTSTSADFGGAGIGSGGYNYLDAAA